MLHYRALVRKKPNCGGTCKRDVGESRLVHRCADDTGKDVAGVSDVGSPKLMLVVVGKVVRRS